MLQILFDEKVYEKNKFSYGKCLIKKKMVIKSVTIQTPKNGFNRASWSKNNVSWSNFYYLHLLRRYWFFGWELIELFRSVV